MVEVGFRARVPRTGPWWPGVCAAAGGWCGPVGVASGRGALLCWIVTFLLAGGPEEDLFVGRAAELARLADVVARVRGGQPWLVTIEGESGVGKTTLARRGLAAE